MRKSNLRMVYGIVILLSMFILSTLSLANQTDTHYLIDNYQTVYESLVSEEGNRVRYVNLNPFILHPDYLVEGDRVILNLFTDVTLEAIIEKITTQLNTTTVRGIIEEKTFSHIIITFTDDNISILINVPEKQTTYRVMYDTEKKVYKLVEINYKNLDELEPMSVLLPDPDSEESPSTIPKIDMEHQTVNDPATITVMVVYTPAASKWAADRGGINNIIAIAMGNSQLTADNSNVGVTFELIHSAEVNYIESSSGSTDLSRLQSTNDGHMDEVHEWRNIYGADLVSLLAVRDDVGGMAYLMNNPNGNSAWGFSLSRIQQTAGLTFIHEVGHTMGLHHHKQQNYQPGPGLFSYSAGWRWFDNISGYCTVMTYTSGQYFSDGRNASRIPVFSSPLITYNGISTGHVLNGDNSRTVREMKHKIAAYRSVPGNLSVTIEPDEVKSLGAKWRVLNQKWLESEDVIILQPGTHTIEFSDVLGWTKPSNMQAVVYQNETTEVFELYTPTKYNILVSANPSEGGTFTGNGEYNHDDTVTLMAYENDGYEFVNWTNGNTILTTNKSYTFKALQNQTLSCNFLKVPSYTVFSNIVAGNGTVNPPTQEVLHGKKAMFDIQPSIGYSIGEVTGCGGTLNGSTYTTGPITQNCSISVTFNIDSYTVTTNTTNGGSVQPTSRVVTHGSITSFQLTPNDWYTIGEVTGCGGTLNGSTYTTGPITQNCSISVTFNINKYVVTANIEEGSGSITPESKLVPHGDNASFKLIPDEGYTIGSIAGCEGALNGDTYTVGPITQNCSIMVTFNLKEYQVTSNVIEGAGVITPEIQIVKYGERTIFEVIADEDYVIETVTGCGGTLSGSTYTTDPITQDCSVDVKFSPKEESIITGSSDGGGGCFITSMLK